MSTFSQLLTEYMARTGVSDSELARTLGVSRQTIFRWKEGLTARPRAREDVLRCAEKLRLSLEECDALVLASGFAPAHAPVPSIQESASAPPAEDLENPPDEPLQIAPTGVADARRHNQAPSEPASGSPRAVSSLRLRLTWFVAAALVVALSTFIFVLRTPATSPYPVAEAGESLIIVSRFAATDGLLARRDSLSDRVQTAIEREIDGRHIDHTRAITWTDDIADANTALFFAQRAGASAVLWGTRAGDQWSVGLVTSRPRVHSYARGLGALIAEPLTPTFSLDPNAVEDIQALALFTLAQLDAQQEEYGSAHAALTQALAASPAATSTRALLLLYSGYWAQVARSPDLVSITESYSQALALDPDLLEAYLDRALVYVRANEPAGWESDLMHVLSVHSDHSGARLALCWAYALDRKPELAMPHCDAAVAHDLTARSREGRAVAAAEAGRLEAAAADMGAFLDWLSKQPEPLRTRYGNTRAGWLQALQAGQNPFTDVVLSQLRVE